MGEMPFSDITFENCLREEKLMGSRCKKCGALYVPPRPICIDCRSSELNWEQMSGSGKLAAFTCIAIGTAAMMAEGYDRKKPYISGVVELDEGARVDARIEGLDGNRPEDIHIGMPMAVKYLHRERGVTYLAFEPKVQP
jgi:hypothetical protein